jgi:hypothetical protein
MEMARTKSKPVMLTIKQASQCAEGLSEYRLRQMCINKEIPTVKAGNKYLICEQVLLNYLTRGAYNG